MANRPLWLKYKEEGNKVDQKYLVSGKTYFLIGNDTKTGFVKIVNHDTDIGFHRDKDSYPPPFNNVNNAGTFYEATIKG